MKKVLGMIFKTLILVALVAWVIIVVSDYMNTLNEKPLKYCIKERVHDYGEDGNVYECIGLGYRVFKYNRKSLTATHFGPIFIKEKQPGKK